jgi:hypothetical protein
MNRGHVSDYHLTYFYKKSRCLSATFLFYISSTKTYLTHHAQKNVIQSKYQGQKPAHVSDYHLNT